MGKNEKKSDQKNGKKFTRAHDECSNVREKSYTKMKEKKIGEKKIMKIALNGGI